MPNGLNFPGLGERILRRILELGYNVRSFAMAHGYDPSYVYRWTSGANAPTLEATRKLSQDLGAPLPWLLLGEEGGPAPAAPVGRELRTKRPRRPVPIAGGSAAAAPLPVERGPDGLPLIRL